MKHLGRILSLLILVSAGLFFANCGGDDPAAPSEEETQLNKFKAATWNISNVTTSGSPADRTAEYAGMKVTFSGTFAANGTYSYSSVAPTGSWPSANPWKPNDSWKFKADAISNKIVRLVDGLEMTYSFSNGDKTLTISFANYTGVTYNGRVNSVAGDWTFVFTRP